MRPPCGLRQSSLCWALCSAPLLPFSPGTSVSPRSPGSSVEGGTRYRGLVAGQAHACSRSPTTVFCTVASTLSSTCSRSALLFFQFCNSAVRNLTSVTLNALTRSTVTNLPPPPCPAHLAQDLVPLPGRCSYLDTYHPTPHTPCLPFLGPPDGSLCRRGWSCLVAGC